MTSLAKKLLPNRLDYLDGLRAILALFVVFHHDMLMAWERPAAPPTPLLWLSWGRLAVDGFIVLSGFCLMLPVLKTGRLRDGPVDFIRRRAWRILPTFYAAVAVSLILRYTVIGTGRTGTHGDYDLPINWHAILACLVMLQDVFQEYRINNVFWSIAVEWKIYFLFPILLWGWRKIGPWKTTAIVLALSNIAWYFTQHKRWESLWLNYIGLFAMGMLAAEIAMTQLDPRAEKILASGWLLALVAILVGSWLKFVGVWPDGTAWWKTWPAVDFPMAVLVVFALVRMAGVEQSAIRKILSLRPLAALGTITYSLYLIHGPMIEIIWRWVCHPLGLGRMGTFVVLVAATPLVIFGAYLFFKIAEEPFLRRKPKTPRRDEVETSGAISPDQLSAKAPPGKISVEKVIPVEKAYPVEKLAPSAAVMKAEGVSLS